LWRCLFQTFWVSKGMPAHIEATGAESRPR
jgi:hypothetical protein